MKSYPKRLIISLGHFSPYAKLFLNSNPSVSRKIIPWMIRSLDHHPRLPPKALINSFYLSLSLGIGSIHFLIPSYKRFKRVKFNSSVQVPLTDEQVRVGRSVDPWARYRLLILVHTLVKFVVVLCPYDKEQMVTKLKFVIIFEYLLTIVYAIQNHLHTKKRTDLPRALFYNFQGTFSSLKVPFTGVSGLHSSILCRVFKLKLN